MGKGENKIFLCNSNSFDQDCKLAVFYLFCREFDFENITRIQEEPYLKLITQTFVFSWRKACFAFVARVLNEQCRY